MNRRGFLKALGIGAVALVAAPLLPKAPVFGNVNLSYTDPFSSATASPEKVAMIRALMDNAIQSHDDAIEAAIFAQANNWQVLGADGKVAASHWQGPIDPMFLNHQDTLEVEARHGA